VNREDQALAPHGEGQEVNIAGDVIDIPLLAPGPRQRGNSSKKAFAVEGGDGQLHLLAELGKRIAEIRKQSFHAELSWSRPTLKVNDTTGDALIDRNGRPL
jgi:hypothetical protein